jgi:acyl-CoA synthetase (AMP-forming)/AMP-acid ligase II/acyl carrier protein
MNRPGSTAATAPALRKPSLFAVLQAQSERAPEAPALLAPGRVPLTYDRLFRQVQDVVQTLNTLGVGRNDRVATVLANGPEMAVAFLAVATGATSAPLNPTYRANEFDFYLADLNAKALVIQSGVDSPVRAVAVERGIPILELSPVPAAEAGVFTLHGSGYCPAKSTGFAQAEDVALVLHTSGTTSRPKIVPLTQANLCSSARNIGSTLELREVDCCLNVMPLFHIHGLIGALLASLVAGASVVCTPGFYAPQFFDWLGEFRPTWYTAVPTMHQAILARAALQRETIARCPLRFLRSSSAALPPQVLAELEETFQVPVIEAYGMTEAAHQMASNPLPPRPRKPGSVGMAAGPEMAIMDETGRLLPPGQVGEVVIRGDNVMSGYENNPVANVSSFTQGWFRTGDQGVLDEEGYLRLTGRLKELINRGGEKIAPREIDEVLLEHPAVAQAVAFGVPHPQLGEDVAAAVVLRGDRAATEKELRDFAAVRLVDFKVPRQIVLLPEIPKGPTGKLQRIGLAQKLGVVALEDSAGRTEVAYRAPSSPTAKDLVRIWTDVLRVSRIGLDDHFFHLGGDSVLAAQVMARIRQAFGLEIPLRTLLDAPTLEGFAALVEQKQIEATDANLLEQELAALAELSEEEAQHLLAQEGVDK